MLNAPSNSGSLYYNYKHGFSTVLMIVCDGRYKILYMDLGSYGHDSDAGIYDRCSFKKAIENKSLNLPMFENLPGTNIVVPYYFLGDNAFPLSRNMMKPFPRENISNKRPNALTKRQRIFNYRLLFKFAIPFLQQID